MKTIKIPYYKETIDIHVAEENLKAVITAKMHEYKAEKGEKELVEDALANPIGSKKLSELAVGKNKIVIVTSDHTRAVPSKLTLPILLKEIRSGNPDADITILIATGLHRPTTDEEQRNMFGDEIVDNEKIVANNAFDPEQFVKVGDLPSGAEFFCNKLACHFGLAAKYYCHFTSPIRRYPDLQIHRIIKEILRGRMDEKRREHYNNILPAVAKQTSDLERRADEAERDTIKMKKVEYMEKRIGRIYEGVISGITKYVMYVELPNTVEGLVHVNTLRDDYYTFDMFSCSMLMGRVL